MSLTSPKYPFALALHQPFVLRLFHFSHSPPISILFLDDLFPCSLFISLIYRFFCLFALGLCFRCPSLFLSIITLLTYLFAYLLYPPLNPSFIFFNEVVPLLASYPCTFVYIIVPLLLPFVLIIFISNFPSIKTFLNWSNPSSCPWLVLCKPPRHLSLFHTNAHTSAPQ